MKKKVIFTVDVEGHVGNNPIEKLVYGVTADGKKNGIDRIMDLLDTYNIKGLFFVDIAEAWHYGEKEIADVLLRIDKRGHDVGVHIHPDHMSKSNKLFLAEYTYEQQYEMISQCSDFYYKILHKRPIAFRAGKYGANWDTLNILNELGYVVDFTEFYGQKWCHIQPSCTINRTVQLDNGLIEVPVSSYRSVDNILYSRIDKIDASMPFGEFKQVFNEMLESTSYNTIVLFAHSFSLLSWRRTPNKPSLNKSAVKKLERQLKYVKRTASVDVIDLKYIIDNRLHVDNNAACDTMKSDDLVVLKGIYSLLYLGLRTIKVVKDRIDIRLRNHIFR